MDFQLISTYMDMTIQRPGQLKEIYHGNMENLEGPEGSLAKFYDQWRYLMTTSPLEDDSIQR